MQVRPSQTPHPSHVATAALLWPMRCTKVTASTAECAAGFGMSRGGCAGSVPGRAEAAGRAARGTYWVMVQCSAVQGRVRQRRKGGAVQCSAMRKGRAGQGRAVQGPRTPSFRTRSNRPTSHWQPPAPQRHTLTSCHFTRAPPVRHPNRPPSNVCGWPERPVFVSQCPSAAGLPGRAWTCCAAPRHTPSSTLLDPDCRCCTAGPSPKCSFTAAVPQTQVRTQLAFEARPPLQQDRARPVGSTMHARPSASAYAWPLASA